MTGKLVPDPEARLPYWEYVGARAAEWPEAEFIVGNPPYLGQARQRDAFGDGYVTALRAAYPDVPDTADFVMYWVRHAGAAVASGRAERAGFITTNSITQSQNRAVIQHAADAGAHVAWAIPDHPWVDDADGADVRVAMLVLGQETSTATRVDVDSSGITIRERVVGRLNADLSADADVATASKLPLLASRGLCSPGFKLHGAGFIVDSVEAVRLTESEPRHTDVIRPYRNGKDLAARPRDAFVIDFASMDEAAARAYPVAFDLVRDRVKPERDANSRAVYARYWWRFGEPRRELRDALVRLTRYIATVETSKHRFFQFLTADTAPDNKVVVIASDDAYVLGALSSAIHVVWALAAGARLGVGNDPVYVKSACFDAFPFPDPPNALRHQIAAVAEELDAHRKHALARDARVTMTGMYNVVAKLRTGEPLTDRERAVHELAACGVLRDLHDALDRLVADAYGWPWPLPADDVLARLVALHDARVAEEAAGVVRWLRPEYQRPRARLAAADRSVELDLPAPVAPEPPAVPAPEVVAPWPATAVEQIAALARLIAARPARAADAAAAFPGAPVAVVERHLDTLAILGEARVDGEGRYAGVATV